MKKLLISSLLCLPLLTTSQSILENLSSFVGGNSTTLPHLSYEQANDIEFAKDYKNNTRFDAYTTKDNFEIKVGDILTIGNAVNERANMKYAYGDVFSNLFVGDVKGRNIKNYNNLEYKYAGTEVIVQAIYVTHKKSTGYNIQIWNNKKETALFVSLQLKLVENNETILASVSSKLMQITVLDIDKALSEGEIVNSNPTLTRSEAIQKLKESKDLMDLGMLSEDEYNNLKDELTPIIMGE